MSQNTVLKKQLLVIISFTTSFIILLIPELRDINKEKNKKRERERERVVKVEKKKRICFSFFTCFT